MNSLKLNLSYSTLELLHTCPRKLELEKLHTGEGLAEESIDLVCGSALGEGIQAILQGASIEKAVWLAYKRWLMPRIGKDDNGNTIQLTEGLPLFAANKKKSFPILVMTLQKFFHARPEQLDGWNLATLPSGRPACEVGFRIKLPNGSTYRGFIDAVLCRPSSSFPSGVEYAALEIKSDGTENVPRAKYENSFQGASYALIVDVITRQINPITFYGIFEFPKLGTQVFDFWKSPADKLTWLPSLALDQQMIDMFAEHQHFPMRGGECFKFFRPCKFLGVCNLPRPTQYVQGKDEPDSMYDFNFTLAEQIGRAHV